MGKSQSPNNIANIYETFPLVIGTGTAALTAATAVGARVYLPYGSMLVTTLGYMCMVANGDVELLILRATVKDGLVLSTIVGRTAQTASAGSSALHAINLVSPVMMQDNDILVINPTGTVQIRVATTYPTLGALKNRTVTKSSCPMPYTAQTFSTSLTTPPYIVAY